MTNVFRLDIDYHTTNESLYKYMITHMLAIRLVTGFE